MIRTLPLGMLSLAGLIGLATPAQASVVVRAPGVQIVVGPCLPCGLGFACRVPLFLRCCRVPPAVAVTVQPPVVVPPPPVVVPSAQPPVIVTPMPAPAPTNVVPGPVVPVPGNVVPAPSLPPVVVTPAPPMTHQEFARIFKPAPGNYEVVLIHPGSKRPVNVCFWLPPGCPRVRVRHRELVFDYGHHHEVCIRFALFGRVRVTNR